MNNRPGMRFVGNLSDPQGFELLLQRWLEWLGVQNYSDKSAQNYDVYTRYFMRWCDERGITQPREVTRPVLERYQRYLYHYRKETGEPLSFRGQRARLAALRQFFKWLTKQNYVLYNPAADIELPRVEKRLPRHVLTVSEVEKIMLLPDLSDGLGIRDRAMLEVLYSTGIRRMEVVNLQLYDVDKERGTLMVRLGKGKKDRMVPIGERALAWVEKYLVEVRPLLAINPHEPQLFLTNLGEPFTPARLTQIVRRYVLRAEIGKTGSCHLFRHTMATLMLENGCDIRFIQAILGHVELSTTQVYTQVGIRKLKEIHTLTHPARLERTTRQDEATDTPTREITADDLLDALDAESEDEQDELLDADDE
ncbi:site-specific tyrosine recombinase XerC [Permianibacter aggregans]|uniref:site-specific tyrosine recombinase XerC n=1 Tax=Permianibacter aggregans TaxID=1510150 RepID=UPI0018DF0F97|nr:site-specific tyrosine recombinase XerC [Permianibacter aggregans]